MVRGPRKYFGRNFVCDNEINQRGANNAGVCIGHMKDTKKTKSVAKRLCRGDPAYDLKLLQNIHTHCKGKKDTQCRNILFLIEHERYKPENRVIYIHPHYNGGSLEDWINKGKHSQYIRKFAEDMWAGLSFLHKKFRVVHCDMKPDNVFVDTSNGRRPTCVIGDLGLATAIGHIQTSWTPKQGMIRGTYTDKRYLSQGYVDVPVKVSRDTFAFVMSVYEMVTGKCPIVSVQMVTGSGIPFQKSQELDAKYSERASKAIGRKVSLMAVAR